MKKSGLFLLFFSFIFQLAVAQNFSAIVKDSLTKEPVYFASITNLNNKKTVISNEKGAFSIVAKPGDILSIASISYSFDTLQINTKVLQQAQYIIYLHPLSKMLDEVTVSAHKNYSAYQLDSLHRRRDFFATTTDYSIPAVSNGNSGVGMGINIDHFFGPDKRKREAIKLFSQMEQEHYINYRFNPTFLKQYVTLPTGSLLLFMETYRPTYKWLRQHPHQEDLIYYINDKLKLFLKK
ncbi:hypothetical protein [Hydrotalea sp.]|uniref:hypothetical protein n=1 Tax=Hydrotalea sp. TaxID=2881279 RepID=UPI0026398401|nr:hypothetical protein [Hydrotalea sp.]